MPRKLEKKLVLWLVAGAIVLASFTAAYFFSRRGGRPLGLRPQLALGIYIGAVAAVVYAFSLRKWALIWLYRYKIFRPVEIAQDALTRARDEIEDLQREIDAGMLTAASDIRSKAAAILARWKVHRALRVELAPQPALPGPRVDLVRREMLGRLEQWLYAHAVFGAVAIAGALYHADFRLGGPVSAALLLAFLGAAVTGVAGGYLYWVVPSRFAAAETLLGYLDTERQIDRVDEELHGAREKKDEALAGLLELQRARLLAHHAPQRRYKRLLELWLVVHVPLAAAALGLLAVHVFSVYWY